MVGWAVGVCPTAHVAGISLNRSILCGIGAEHVGDPGPEAVRRHLLVILC